MQIEISGSELHHYKTGKLLNRLPGMNDIVAVSKLSKGRYSPYNDMKAYYEVVMSQYFRKCPKFEVVNIHITWIEPNKRRDIDNIAAGVKFIMDSLVRCGVIQNDSQKFVKGLQHTFDCDPKNPRIIVEIEEVE